MKTFSDRIKIALSGMLAVSLLASCSSQAVTETTQPAVPESSPSTEASVSESETTEEETSETSFTVETEEKNNPLLDYQMENSDEYSLYGFQMIWDGLEYEVGIDFGFDNPYTISKLQELAYDATGEQYDSLTLSDVSYFQGTGYLNMYSSLKFFDLYDSEPGGPYYIETARAVLASEGLRFGIDEIPASFFLKRFPRFCYDAMEFGRKNKALVDYWDEYNIELPDPSLIDSLWAIPEDYLNGYSEVLFVDYQIFKACLFYNDSRSMYMYNNPWGSNVIQVRDAATGKNVLVPTEGQAEQLQEDINSIPGCENINIFVSETPEEFYECYGYYPDDLIYGYIIEDNTPEGFEEYYNSLPEDDQNELYAPILFD